jgi:hypothetical protein
MAKSINKMMIYDLFPKFPIRNRLQGQYLLSELIVLSGLVRSIGQKIIAITEGLGAKKVVFIWLYPQR